LFAILGLTCILSTQIMTHSKRYAIAFEGKVLDGHAEDAVVARFAAMFRREAGEIRARMFSGARVFVRRGLDHEQAQRYAQALRAAGAICAVVPEGQPAPLRVPEPGEGKPFAEVWRRIVELRALYIPCGLAGGEGAPPAGQTMLDFVDTAWARYEDGMKIGVVFTDRGLAAPDVLLAPLPTAQALARFFHNSALDGLAFNPLDAHSRSTAPGQILLRHAIPRVAGMAASGDPFARSATHPALARAAAAADQVYTAYHHAAAAREAGAQLDSCFFAEIGALLLLGLAQQAREFFDWYARQGGADARIGLVSAQMLTLSGQGARALDAALPPLLEHPEHSAWAWREQGRALFATGRAREAVAAFEESLRRDASSVQTRLGLGIALRTVHWEPQNDDGLRQALAHFEQVAAAGDFHVAEALHHAGTLQLALGDFGALEALMRRTLELRNSPVSRRNLCIALHAQGKLEEAAAHYRFLAEHFPAEGAPLRKYFQ
jgi:tetratricopeptide (TPR) repeat protein